MTLLEGIHIYTSQNNYNLLIIFTPQSQEVVLSETSVDTKAQRERDFSPRERERGFSPTGRGEELTKVQSAHIPPRGFAKALSRKENEDMEAVDAWPKQNNTISLE